MKFLYYSLLLSLGVSCSGPAPKRFPAQSKIDASQFFTIEGHLNYWADSQTPKTQTILKNNNDLIKIVYMNKGTDVLCSLTGTNSRSSTYEEDGVVYYNVNQGDSINCAFTKVPDVKSYKVSYALDVLKPVTPSVFMGKIASVRGRIETGKYDQKLFDDLQELGLLHLFTIDETIASDPERMFRKVNNVLPGDYISLKADPTKTAGLLCDSKLECKINSDFKGLRPGSSEWKESYQKKLAFKEYQPLELVCGKWDKASSTLSEVNFRGSQDESIVQVMTNDLHCLINHPVKAGKKLENVIGHYRLSGMHISRKEAAKRLDELQKTSMNNLEDDINILNLRRYQRSLIALHEIAINVKLDLHQSYQAKLARVNAEEKKLTDEINKRREAELTKLSSAFGGILANYRSSIAKFAPWETNQVFGDYEYQVKIIPRYLRHSGQVRYELTQELVLKKSKENFFIESSYVEYVLLGKSEFYTLDDAHSSQPSEMFRVCSEDFHKIKIDLADQMEINSGKKLYDIFRSFKKSSCQTSLQRAANYQLNLVHNFNDQIGTSYCFAKTAKSYSPSAMRVHYDHGVYKEIDRSHPFFKTAPIAMDSDTPSMVRGQKEFCTDIYYGVFPIHSQLYFTESYDPYVPLRLQVSVDKRDEWPNLSARLQGINQRFDVEFDQVHDQFNFNRSVLERKFRELMMRTGIKARK